MRAAAARRALDGVGAATGLVVSALIVVGAAAAVRLTMGARVLRHHTRPGREGVSFTMLAFRTVRAPQARQPEGAEPAAGLDAFFLASRRP